MKIVNLIGGLGNQMFQYALYLSLRQQFPHDEVRISTGAFRGYGLHGGFELERVFRLSPAPRATWHDLLRIAWPYVHHRLWQVGRRILPHRATMLVEPVSQAFLPQVLTQSGPLFYDGYWQDERYFLAATQAVRHDFTFPPFTDSRDIALEGNLCAESARKPRPLTASLHVRRGDYLASPLYRGLCDVDYYSRAIAALDAHLAERGERIERFLLFTNDPEWASEHILPLLHGREALLVDWHKGTESYRDMQLMATCHHHIIANSSFSWWGAWLNPRPDRIVIGPSRWLNRAGCQFRLPEGWLTV